MNKYTIIQNTWMGDDDVDLLNYVKFNNIPTKFLSVEEILELNISEIDVLFADTCVVQKLINPICVPECYPEVFDKLYHRKIQTICAKDAFNIKTKCFIKPYDNNKSFNNYIRILTTNDRIIYVGIMFVFIGLIMYFIFLTR